MLLSVVVLQLVKCTCRGWRSIAGVIEPPSASPVIIEDDVLIGANAVILEGVRVGKGAIVAAGAIVTQDVPAGAVVAGTPAKVIKQASEVQDTKKRL